MWRFEEMFVSNICRIIVETTRGPCRTIWNWNQGLTIAVLQSCPTAFAGSMQDLKVSHRGSHRTIGRLTFECWVFLTVEYRINGRIWISSLRWLGKERKPPFAHLTNSSLELYSRIDKLIVEALQSYCLSHRHHEVPDSLYLRRVVIFGHLKLKTLNQRYWRRLFARNVHSTVCWWSCHMTHVGPTRFNELNSYRILTPLNSIRKSIQILRSGNLSLHS